MSQFPIDVDAEAVFLDGTWYTREDLTRRIKAMLDGGDFNVARPSAALQELTQALQGIRTLAFRCAPDLADALNQLATRLGQSTGYVIREAITQYITDANSAPQPQQQPLQLHPHDQTQRTQIPVMPVSVDVPMGTGTTHEELPKVVVEPSIAAVPIAGPGALKAAGIAVPEQPVELTNKKAQPAENTDPSAEHRWFKQ